MVEGTCEAPPAAKQGAAAEGRKPWHAAKGIWGFPKIGDPNIVP